MFTDEESPDNQQVFKPTCQAPELANDSSDGDLDTNLADQEIRPYPNTSEHRTKRPMAASLKRRRERMELDGARYETPTEEPNTISVSKVDPGVVNVETDDVQSKGTKVVADKHNKTKSANSGKHPSVSQNQGTANSGKARLGHGNYPNTSTPNNLPQSAKTRGMPYNSPKSPKSNVKQIANKNTTIDKGLSLKNRSSDKTQKEMGKPGNRKGSVVEQNVKQMVDVKKHVERTKDKHQKSLKNKDSEMLDTSIEFDSHVISTKAEKRRKDPQYNETRRRSRDESKVVADINPLDDKSPKETVKYRNDDCVREKIKKSTSKKNSELKHGSSDSDQREEEEAQLHGVTYRRKRSHISPVLEQKQVLCRDLKT